MPPARKGYAGTMILYKEGMEAKKSCPRIGAPDTMDDEGRLLTLEFDDFYFVNVYTGISESVMVRAVTAALEDVTNRKFTKNMQQKKEKVS